MNRLFGGRFVSREDATEAARTVPASFGLRPIVVKREFLVLHGFPGNAALIFRKKSLSRQP
jgi:hypothetical protein